MSYFFFAGQKRIFSLCKNGEWMGSSHSVVCFDYGDDVLRVRQSEISPEDWEMLLQVLNLDAT